MPGLSAREPGLIESRFLVALNPKLCWGWLMLFVETKHDLCQKQARFDLGLTEFRRGRRSCFKAV